MFALDAKMPNFISKPDASMRV